MPPRKQKAQVLPPLSRVMSTMGTPDDDLENMSAESRIILEKLDSVRLEIVDQLKARDERIDKLESDVSVLKRENRNLRNRLDDIESNQRSDSLILSGDALPTATMNENPVQIVEDVLKSKLNISTTDIILSAYRIGNKPVTQSPDRRKVMVKLKNSQSRIDIIHSCKTVKPSQLYVSENLVQSRAELLYALRQAKKREPQKLLSCWSRDGRIYDLLKATSAQSNNYKVRIDDRLKLEELFEKTLGFHVSDVLKD